MRNSANGYWSFVRKEYAAWNFDRNYDVTVHVYNINTYKNFLIVYVANNQVIGWTSTSEIMGVDNGTVIRRGSIYKDYSSQRVAMVSPRANGAYIGSFTSPDNNGGSCTIYNIANEKKIELHMLNALRAIKDRAPVERSKYIEGCDLETLAPMYFTGFMYRMWDDDITITNRRFGSQAWAESLDASKIRNGFHDPKKFTAGPLAIDDGVCDSDIQAILSQKETGYAVFSSNQVALRGQRAGEDAIMQFANSDLHIGSLFDSTNVYVGIGISGNYHVIDFSEAPEYFKGFEPYTK